MMRIGDGHSDALKGRIGDLFAEAARNLHQRVEKVVADQSANRSLQSGATIKKVMAAAREEGETAVEGALDAYERACQRLWVSRVHLKAVTRDAVEAGVAALAEQGRDRLWKIGFEAGVLGVADGLAQHTKMQALATVDARFDGWTGQVATFARRHPGWTAAGGFLLGVLADHILELVKFLAEQVVRLWS